MPGIKIGPDYWSHLCFTLIRDRDEEKVKSLRIWASSVNIVPPTTSESIVTALGTSVSVCNAWHVLIEVSHRIESPPSDGPQYLRSISDIEDNAYFDLICKVLSSKFISVRVELSYPLSRSSMCGMNPPFRP